MRRQLAVVVLALVVAGCKHTTTEPPSTPALVAAQAPVEPRTVEDRPIVLGHAMCVSIRACREFLAPLIAQRPMPPKVQAWFETNVDEERAGGALLLVLDGAIVPVGILPIRSHVAPPGSDKYPTRIVGDHVFLAETRLAVDAAALVTIPGVQRGPDRIVDGRVDIAALPPELRSMLESRLDAAEASAGEWASMVLGLDFLREVLSQSDSIDIDVVKTREGRFELDCVVLPRPDTRLADRAAVNASPRSPLVAAIPPDAMLQLGALQRLATPDEARAVFDLVKADVDAGLTEVLAESTASEASKRVLTEIVSDIGELARAYIVRDAPVEIVAFMPPASAVLVILLRGIDPAIGERMGKNLVEAARAGGLKTAHSTREGGGSTYSLSVPSGAPAQVFGPNLVVKLSMRDDTLVAIVGGDKKKLPSIPDIAKTLAGAQAGAVANRWIRVDATALGRTFESDAPFLRGFDPADGTVGVSLTSDGRAWHVRLRADMLSPSNLARRMRAKSQ